MVKKITETELTEEQKAAIPGHVQKWIDIGLQTGDADMPKFRDAIRRIYDLTKIPQPRCVVLVENPVVAAYVNGIALCAIDNERTFDPETLPIQGEFRENIVKGLKEIFSHFPELEVDTLNDQILDMIKETLRNTWSDYFGGQFWAGYQAFISFLRGVCKLELESQHLTDCADAYEDAQTSVTWWYPTKYFVVATDRPKACHNIPTNNPNQLRLIHKDLAPAISFAGGVDYYKLNGVDMKKEYVLTPADQLDSKVILHETNADVRRELVRKIGAAKVCRDLNAKTVEVSGNYELLMLDLGDGRQRPYLKMVNPSIGEIHIEGLLPEMTTVRQAIMYRNGLTEDMVDEVNGADYYQQGDVLLFPAGAKTFKLHPKILT